MGRVGAGAQQRHMQIFGQPRRGEARARHIGARNDEQVAAGLVGHARHRIGGRQCREGCERLDLGHALDAGRGETVILG
jgi:hypothetical protein